MTGNMPSVKSATHVDATNGQRRPEAGEPEAGEPEAGEAAERGRSRKMTRSGSINFFCDD